MAAEGERSVDRGTLTDWEGFMKDPFAAATQGPLGVDWCLEQVKLSARVMKWSVAPESAIADGDGEREGGITFLDNKTDA